MIGSGLRRAHRIPVNRPPADATPARLARRKGPAGLLLLIGLLGYPGSGWAQQQPFLHAPGPAAAPASPAAPEPAGTVSGAVTAMPNGTTLIVGNQPVRLAGIDPAPPEALRPIEDWLIHKAGVLQCQPLAQTGRYVCRAADGADIAGTMLRNGAARVGTGATADYRKFEDDARENQRGLWKQP